MAAAIPAAIGIGQSLIGGIQGKGAVKRQQQLAQQQMAQLQPLINAQLAASQFGLNQAQQLMPQASQGLASIFNQSQQAFQPLAGMSGSYLQGAGNALQDLQSFYRPFMQGGQRAIDQFLPSTQRVQETFAPEFGNVNQGYKSASENIARFAPRGGGRVSSLTNLDLNRQNQLSNTFFQGRNNLWQQGLGTAFQAAGQQGNIAEQLRALGLGTGQQALGYLGQGLNASSDLGRLAQGAMGLGLEGGNMASNLYNQQANRAFAVQPANTGWGPLGSTLVDIFKDPKMQSGINKLFGIGQGGKNPPTSTNIGGMDFPFIGGSQGLG